MTNLNLLHPPADIVTATRAGSLPRVLFAVVLDPGQKFGSLEEQIVVLARRFRAEGGLFLPLFLSDVGEAGLAKFREHGVDGEILERRRTGQGSLRQLLRLVTKHRIDVVHWNFTAPLFNRYLWWLSVLRPGLAHYYTDHISRTQPPAPPGVLKRWFKWLLLRRYAKVFAISQYVADALAVHRTWSNVVCSRYFINTDRFRPDAAERARLRRELAVDDRFVALLVGQLIRDKGMDVALAALPTVPERVVLWVVGAGSEREALERQAAELGVADRVRFLGLQADVRPFMQAADSLLCPSRWGEAVGLVNLEAAACGLPIVASRVGGIPEYVSDGRTGYLIPPEDAAALADRLRALSGDAELCRSMSDAARAFAVERFSIAARVEEIVELYRH